MDQFTPLEPAKWIIDSLEFEPGETLFEPCRGKGAFYDQFPAGHDKGYCEILEGIDFYEHTKKYDTIITNPPFKAHNYVPGTNVSNETIKFIEHCFKVARKRVVVLINHKSLNAITPTRIEKWKPWAITRFDVMNIKKWWGRYYVIVFEKNATPIIRHLKF